MTGIEPAYSVWKTEALPLSYIRECPLCEGGDHRATADHVVTNRPEPLSPPMHQHQGAVVVGLLHRVDEQLGAAVEADLDQALAETGELVHAEGDVALGSLDQAVG